MEEILDKDQFKLMTLSLGIGRRLSDSDRKIFYDVMAVRCRQAFATAQHRVERLKTELAAEETRLVHYCH